MIYPYLMGEKVWEKKIKYPAPQQWDLLTSCQVAKKWDEQP
jgi:hypothetical protein